MERLEKNVFYDYKTMEWLLALYGFDSVQELYNSDAYISSGGAISDIVEDLKNAGLDDIDELIYLTQHLGMGYYSWCLYYIEQEEMYVLMDERAYTFS